MNLTPIALTSIGAYAAYSGIRGTCKKSDGQSKGWQMAKVAAGLAMI